MLQIEKFIESLFPSQTAAEAKLKLSGQDTEADAKKKKEREMQAWNDMKAMFIIMGILVTFITGLMVKWLNLLYDQDDNPLTSCFSFSLHGF